MKRKINSNNRSGGKAASMVLSHVRLCNKMGRVIDSLSSQKCFRIGMIDFLRSGDKVNFQRLSGYGLTLKKANLRKLDLSGLDFTSINMNGSDLRDADLSLTDFGFEMPRKVKLSVEFDFNELCKEIHARALDDGFFDGGKKMELELEQEYNGVTYCYSFWLDIEFALDGWGGPSAEVCFLDITDISQKAFLNSDDREFIRPKIFDNLTVDNLTKAINDLLS